MTLNSHEREFKAFMFFGHMGYDVVHAGKGITPTHGSISLVGVRAQNLWLEVKK